MKYLKIPVFEKKIYKDLIILKFKWNGTEENVYPGQFFMIGAENSEVLLNRPFSISDYANGILTFRIKVVGKFTQFLKNAEENFIYRVIGPLGNSINIEYLKQFDKVVLIGGGIGIAPLIYFNNFLKEKKIDSILVYGCASKQFLYYAIFENKQHPIIFTEDGSVGFKGFPTDYINYFSKNDNILIIACGPEPMYKTLTKYLDFFPIKVLLEQKMGCGFGACLGCVVNTEKGFFHVCKEGPICDLEVLYKIQETTNNFEKEND